MYDYLIVGAGLSGAIFYYEATKREHHVNPTWRAGVLPLNLCLFHPL